MGVVWNQLRALSTARKILIVVSIFAAAGLGILFGVLGWEVNTVP